VKVEVGKGVDVEKGINVGKGVAGVQAVMTATITNNITKNCALLKSDFM